MCLLCYHLDTTRTDGWGFDTVWMIADHMRSDDVLILWDELRGEWNGMGRDGIYELVVVIVRDQRSLIAVSGTSIMYVEDWGLRIDLYSGYLYVLLRLVRSFTICNMLRLWCIVRWYRNSRGWRPRSWVGDRVRGKGGKIRIWSASKFCSLLLPVRCISHLRFMFELRRRWELLMMAR